MAPFTAAQMRIILGAILFYPNQIILCRDTAVLSDLAGVVAGGVLPALYLSGAVALIDLRQVCECGACHGADGGGKECRRNKL